MATWESGVRFRASWGEWFYSRLAALLWSSLAVWVFLGNVEIKAFDSRFPFPWQWLVVAYIFVCLDCFLLDRQAALEIARRRGEAFVPLTKRFLIIIIGGPIGVISWMVAFAAMAGGWLAGGGWGLAVGAVVAKITYIPWIIGVIREARRRPPSAGQTAAGPGGSATAPAEKVAAAPAATGRESASR